MWPWKKPGRGAKLAPTTLEERLTALESEFRLLRAEWTDTFDKFYRLAGRMDATKRWLGEKTPSPGTTEGENAAPAPSEGQVSAIPPLSPADGRTSITRRDILARARG